ncbi:putative mating-type switching protein swi10 [Papiliotrema laurentii]|uniref:Mating-type switching protein swi10 n=1 Tax=Papiliotrema laurentii TaxID=5418 RepID=A0AAD9CY37_PAPLA|nr:putative mating-type switching protein swi10 [Papiliotrema laurentii]
MGEVAGNISATGAKSGPPIGPPGFQRASEVLRASSAALPGPSSVRDASNGTASAQPSSNGLGEGEQSSHASGSATNDTAPPVNAVKKPINRPATSKNAIVYNARRNPVLQSIKNVGIEIGDIVADYQVGTHNGVLFLSLKYHRLHPEYIHQRIEKMKNMYNVRILLVLCDINEHQQSLREISKIAIINNYTTFVAWSNEEVAQYLTTFKAYEHKGDDSLKEPIHQSYNEQFYHVMTSGKKVNKTDADNLASQFGSFANISKQSSKVLSTVKGLGATKVTSLIDAFNKPFLVGGLKREGADEAPTPVILNDTPVTASNDGPGEQDPEPVGSPDWPDEPAEDEEEGKRVEAWKDPLDEDDVEEEEAPATKRPRISG